MKRASAAMTRDVVVVGTQMPLKAAWGLMQQQRIRHLLVVLGGSLVGILSDRDVLLRATARADGTVEVPADPVALAMTPAVVTCGPDAKVSDLASLMIDRKIDAIPVLGKAGTLIGLVTSSDLLALIHEDGAASVLPFDFRVFDGERLTAVA